MVYTVTLNPALDYVMHLDCLQEGKTNRTVRQEIQYGGKGINVSTVLHRLGVETCALGFLAGFTGKALEEGLRQEGLHTDFVWLAEGSTRINVKLKAGQETEINAQGPAIPEKALEELLEKLDKLQPGDGLVLAGSVPPSLPKNIYERILQRTAGKAIYAAVDAEGELLRRTLCYRPLLVKPNRDELSGLAGRSLRTEEELREAAELLRQQGARNVLVSLGGEGSLLLDEQGGVHRLGVPAGTLRSSVGAGDSMLAGFLAGWLQSKDAAAAHRLSAAAGSATAYSDGLADRETVEKLLCCL